ncbi:unnamed protein product [Schistosoma margrebowiei]|uniref:Uncharacterized protein n=1 Tax=Schistosoma margrebowiei TaxID=48269 RepID=A0A183MQI2_9TREM|nr:unnamed protein product [Schistosoma margrebowiei]
MVLKIIIYQINCTHLASNNNAIIPAAIGAHADVPECIRVQS